MELKDEIIINASQAVVYAALNDPEVLKQCIPGCEELIKHSNTELEAKVVLKIGPVKAKFSGNVTRSPAAPPERFSLAGTGNGGAPQATSRAALWWSWNSTKTGRCCATPQLPILVENWRSWAAA